MIIFINGAFGVGKTTVAKLLIHTLPNSMLYDPEEIGLALRTMLEPIEKNDDFQHYPEWRSLTIEAARSIKQRLRRDLVVPMTIWREEYFKEVIKGLKEIDSNFYHFCLMASVKTIYQRLNERGEQKPESWAHQQAEQTVPALASPLFDEHIDTEKMSAAEISEYILSRIS